MLIQFNGQLHILSIYLAGKAEAKAAGEALKKDGYEFDLAYTSYLKRANETLGSILEVLGKNVDTQYSWRLNERHYGGLTGLNKAETAKKYGDEQVKTNLSSFFPLFLLLKKG